MLSNTASDPSGVAKTVFGYLRAQGDTDYIGEAVSQLEHSLQAAAMAVEAGSEDELVLAALLHDVGRFLPQSAKLPRMLAPDGTYIGTASHESVGERFLLEVGFPSRVCAVVGAHVWAKRYLCATEEGYWEALSKSSKASLVHQGGPFTPEQVEKAKREDPLIEEKLAVRRWDDLAKVPGVVVPGLEAYEEMALKCLQREAERRVTVHGRVYSFPERPTVVICVDGFDPAYLDQGISDGILPTLKGFTESGFHVTGDAAMPTFTNPNNVSIITGVPTAIHGIAGNYFLDRKTGEEKMITDDSLLHGTTVLAEMASGGVRVTAITAKDKLRRILQHGLPEDDSICFSAELASDKILSWLGRDARPDQYSGELSLFVLDAGVRVLQDKDADLLYLTLSDYIQHKYKPGEKESDEFLAAVDARVKQMVDLGAVVALTGDHGMSSKSGDDGKPNVLFLQDELEKRFGKGCARVICPITDPFVKHHGALGSYVTVYVDDAYRDRVDEMVSYSAGLAEVEKALLGAEATAMFEMPADQVGEFSAVARQHAVLGSRAEDHDLSGLDGRPLRSHGGLSEQAVPLILSRPVTAEKLQARKHWRNFDVFDLALNYQG